MTDPANILSGIDAVLAAEAVPLSEVPVNDCKHPDTWFDRSFCAEPCGQMHDVCTDCLQSIGCYFYRPEVVAAEMAEARREQLRAATYPEALAVVRAAEERFDAAEPFLYDYPMSQDERQFMWERLRETTIAYRAALAAFLAKAQEHVPAARDATEAGS